MELGLFSSSNNKVGNGTKISFNLHNTDAFDDEIREETRNTPTGKFMRDTYRAQGISPGYKDAYGWDLAGQAIIVGDKTDVKNLAGSSYEIRVEVDPEGKFTERTKKNNLARTSYEMPKWSSSGFCDRALDCDGVSKHMSYEKMRQGMRKSVSIT